MPIAIILSCVNKASERSILLSSGQTDSALRGEQLACAFEDGEVTFGISI
jgi:hypothetical protein